MLAETKTEKLEKRMLYLSMALVVIIGMLGITYFFTILSMLVNIL